MSDAALIYPGQLDDLGLSPSFKKNAPKLLILQKPTFIGFLANLNAPPKEPKYNFAQAIPKENTCNYLIKPQGLHDFP